MDSIPLQRLHVRVRLRADASAAEGNHMFLVKIRYAGLVKAARHGCNEATTTETFRKGLSIGVVCVWPRWGCRGLGSRVSKARSATAGT